MSLSWDWETRGVIDLRTRGVYVYAQHPETDALIASYRLNVDTGAAQFTPAIRVWIAAGGEINKLYRWKRGEACPPWVRAYIEAGGELVAHNCAFERLIWQHVMTPRHGWPVLCIEQCRCTAVTAAAMSLPRDLERLGDALDLKIKKDKRGAALMKVHSIPQKDGSWHPLADDPVSLEAYHTYCDFDVLSEDEAAERLIPLSDEEMRVYWMNERINDKGLRIDVRSARAAVELIAKAKQAIDVEISEVTGGIVTAVTQAARLKTWIESQGVVMPSMDKDDVDDFLHSLDDLPANVKRALELRQEGAKPSVEKIAGMLSRTNKDGRVQGVYLHHGAGQTGRFSSRGPLQAHNMPKYRKIFENAHLDQNILFDFIRQGDPAVLQAVYGLDLGRPLHLLSDAVRGFIWAEPGHELLVADYASIEGRMGAWFTGEEWEVEAYRALDRGEGHGIYELNAADIYQIDIGQITPTQRKLGKVRSLSCSYQTGPAGILKFARQEKVKMTPLFPALWEVSDGDRREAAEKRYADRMAQGDAVALRAGREAWIAAELIKVSWRAKHPRFVASWADIEETAIAAVRNPGQRFNIINCSYIVAHGFLWCRLPSGRCLAYGKPKIFEQVYAREEQDGGAWGPSIVMDRREAEDRALNGGPKAFVGAKVKIERAAKPKLTARGVDSVTEKWMRFPIYGGSLFNNCVSAESKVLTPYGWKCIMDVSLDDLLWDGEAWVQHHGVVSQGLSQTVDIAGVRMTPEHKVWNGQGWERADHANIHTALAASSRPGFIWKDIWTTDCSIVRRGRWAQELVECSLRMRRGEDDRRRRTDEGQTARENNELRLLPEGERLHVAHDTRHVLPPRLSGMAGHARSMLRSFAQGIRSLRWPGHSGLRSMATLQGILSRHEADMGAGANSRADAEQRRLLTEQLHLGEPSRTGAQQTRQRDDRHADRPDAALRGIGSERHWHDDALLSSRRGLANEPDVRRARPLSQNYELVVDIVNAGPRHRFTVQAENGQSIIVSNCVQGSARDILVHGMLKAEAKYGALTGHTHDELFVEVPRGSADVKAFEKMICELPQWAATLPLTAAGFVSKRYAKK